MVCYDAICLDVSTRSRPKAAGRQYHRPDHADQRGFNTQPPEGGWFKHFVHLSMIRVSTRSRPKAAGRGCLTNMANF